MSEHTERTMTLRLPDELHAQLRERAKAEDRSIAQVIRVATRHYLQVHDPTVAACQ